MSVAAKRVLRLPPLPTIRDLVKLYRLQAIKQLSQNFLMDERLSDKIVRAAGKLDGNTVLEVGPGPGGITRSIIRRCPKRLVLVEKDRRFLPTLELLQEATQGHVEVSIVRDDILKYPTELAFADVPVTEWEGARAPIHLIGNLPFAISTRLLINWLKDVSLRRGAWASGRAGMTLTFQQEVGERITAPILDNQRCRLSVMSQIWTVPFLKFIIPGRAFVPPPDVNVAVVTIVPLKVPKTQLPFDLVEKVVRHIFSMRQKYIRRGIGNLFPEDVREQLTEQVFREADLDPTLRSFQLSVEECLRLADAFHNIVKKHPRIDQFNYRAPKDQRFLLSDDPSDVLEVQ
ncbi:dimethyladenosine transferase 1, mitochondrial [Phlebotomus argentipes]|uniref:dimethyladenosine transferase 1, mitochondrial n=1 Tax=Phlebotomus argentipes TaxID=94469 RepID=UPI002892FBB8|nr:dimethyladenosine transferase 1, mitochondrial [Phlebotomus argentipes]